MSTRPALAAAAGVIAGALLLGVGEVLQSAVRAAAFGQPFGWSRNLTDSVGSWLLVATATPLAFVASRRARLTRPRLARAVAIHAGASLLFAAFGVVTVAAFLALRKPDLSFALLATKGGTFYLLFYIAIYWTLVAAIHATHYHREVRAREAQLVRERLEVLRRKLEPHFLFNTLNAIATLALEGDGRRVADSLGLVGTLLRSTLDDALPQEIPLRRELELIDTYLGIQQLRFGDRLRVERALEPSTLDALVPSMLLQPLVENAICHGVAGIPGPGVVRLEARLEDHLLRLAVVDSGAGFPLPSRTGVGLANTRERLETLYGNGHRFTVTTPAGGGARVEVVIPQRPAPTTTPSTGPPASDSPTAEPAVPPPAAGTAGSP